MFTVTDEDRKIRKEGEAWRAKCKRGIMDDDPSHEPIRTYKSQEEGILASSLSRILWGRTSLLRFKLRQGESTPFRVHVTVSQRALEEAMAETRMKVMSEKNVRKLIYRYISEDFKVDNILIDFPGTGRHLTIPGNSYTSFYLSVRA